jgi:hypothetical protein
MVTSLPLKHENPSLTLRTTRYTDCFGNRAPRCSRRSSRQESAFALHARVAIANMVAGGADLGAWVNGRASTRPLELMTEAMQLVATPSSRCAGHWTRCQVATKLLCRIPCLRDAP